jgi:hypothetical protein
MADDWSIDIWDQYGVLGPSSADVIARCLFAQRVPISATVTITDFDNTRPFILAYYLVVTSGLSPIYNSANYNAATQTYSFVNNYVDNGFFVCIVW